MNPTGPSPESTASSSWLTLLGATPTPTPPGGQYAGRVVRPFNLKDLPDELQERILSKWLTFSEQMVLMAVNKQLYQDIGNHPIFGWTLIKSGLGLPYPCSRPAATLGALVSHAIRSGDGVCMAQMADNLEFCDRDRLLMFSLLEKAGVQTTHPRHVEAQNTVVTNCWRNQLRGRPPIGVLEPHLWGIFLGRAMTHINISSSERASRYFQLMQRAIWGFCDANALVEARNIAFRMSAPNGPAFSPSQRKTLEVFRGLLSFFTVPTAGAKDAAWQLCRAHLNSPGGKSVLRRSQLVELVQLLDQLQTLGQVRTVESDAQIAKSLMTLYKTSPRLPHVRALAGLTLAGMIQIGRTDIMSTEDVLDILGRIISNEGLRGNVREVAKLVRCSFQLRDSHLQSPHALHEMAVFAGKCLQPGQMATEAGIGINQPGYAQYILAQLTVLGIPTTQELALNAWHESPPNSNERINAGLQVAKFNFAGGIPYDFSRTHQAVACLKEILYFAKTAQQLQEAKLLLAGISVKTLYVHGVSKENTVSFCWDVYRSDEASAEMKALAIGLLGHTPSDVRNAYLEQQRPQ